MSDETRKVDVLAVMDAEIAMRNDAATAWQAAGDRDSAIEHAFDRDQLKRARAAVAVMIEADLAFDVARRNFAPCSDEVLESSARRSAALARIGAKL